MKKQLVIVMFIGLLGNMAQADCWGNVSYLTKKSNGNIEAGITPKDGTVCSCTTTSSGNIGFGTRVLIFPASSSNIKESYSALLAAVTSKSMVYIFSSSCSATEVMSYAQ